jgi:hypothetical protein
MALNVPLFQNNICVGSPGDVPKFPNCSITLWFQEPVASLHAVGEQATNDSVVIRGGVGLNPAALK